MIAKRADLATVRHERIVYDKILPAIQVPRLRFYGTAVESDGKHAWLFIEDAGGEPYLPASRLRINHRQEAILLT